MIIGLIISLSALLIISGLCDLIMFFKLFAVAPKKHCPSYIIIYPNESDAFDLINLSLQKLNWYGMHYAEGIIVVSDKIDDLLSLKKSFFDNRIFYCKENEISNLLSDLSF